MCTDQHITQRWRQGAEADHAEIQGWAHEIRAWMNLTNGDYHGVIAAPGPGSRQPPHHGVAIQLAAEEAKTCPGQQRIAILRRP